MVTDVVSLSDVGSRLRAERERIGLSQEDFGALARVSRNSQVNYETGKRAFDAEYLLRLIENGIDSHFVMTGRRSSEGTAGKRSMIVNAFDSLDASNQRALLHLACSLAQLSGPAAPVSLPSTAALEEALAGFLESSPGLQGDELVRELAMSLPTLLRGAADEIVAPRLDQAGILPVRQATSDGDRRAGRQGQRT